jgi:hypothetical protein
VNSVPTIGFVLLTHANEKQILRLVSTLNEMFNNPPIVCHHDFSKEQICKDNIPENVKFIDNYVATQWGKFSLIEAKMLALEALYSGDNCPDWFVFLSAADYPVVSAKKLLKYLSETQYDVFIKYTKINYGNWPKQWHKDYYKRYCGLNILADLNNKQGQKVVRQLPLAHHPILTRLFSPFKNGFDCYAGDQWYTCNRLAAKAMLEFYTNNPRVIKHYKNTKIPDESFYQSVFCNDPNLNVSSDNLRYIDWSAGEPHPKALDETDFLDIVGANKHFARKINYLENDPLIEKLDAHIFAEL